MISTLFQIGGDVLQSRDKRLKLLLFIALGAFAVYFGFFHYSAMRSVGLIKHWGYYFMLAILLAFIWETYCVTRARWADLLPWLRQYFNWKFCAVLGVLSIYLWTSQEVGYKVIMDEINLLGTSMYLHLDKQAMSILRGYELNGVFLPLDGFVDKRPLFYPFLVSLIHDFTGYRPENAFALNLTLIPVALILSYVLGVLVSNARGGLLAMLLLACFPMFNQCCHGGGFEALNVVMILVVFLASCLYLREPSPGLLSVLCLSAVILANVRYESVLFILPVALVIMTGWYRSRGVIFSRGFFLTPILLVPVPMLYRVFEIDPENTWQLGSKEAASPFSLEFLPRNLGQCVSMFFDTGHEQPVSVFLSTFGLIGMILFLVLLLRKAREKSPIKAEYLALAFTSLGVLMLLGLLLLYFWDFDDNMTRRLALPIVVLMIFPGVASLGSLKRAAKIFPWVFALTCLALIVEVAPRYSKDMFTKGYDPGAVTNWKREVIREHEGEYNLFIDIPGLWVTHEVPAITQARAIEKKELLKFHLNNKTFDHIYVVEGFVKDFSDGVLRGGRFARLDDDFVLEPMTQKTFNNVIFIRISEVVDIKAEEPDWIKERFEMKADEGETRSEQLDFMRLQQKRLARLLP
ncbi:glycosyltransferase family 39 protein [Cerasicoccus arenae]|uniref:Glycosyltransferase RgtA/B/C/D-like domain-containing protein n=1 Tax=Cerasicoccus arenae TaxID=424488 RepID=A0A8J3GDL2_9BACT|nr:glycosyltransferase family 39 protein [Cerasicoccus arenae]MBK1859536.1 glycosyltransferase family 39 protein [Cerasicoccus arenae]GHB97216.1 hypothetical protein GCM10007047_11530 [Cerasicoccus arenae]